MDFLNDIGGTWIGITYFFTFFFRQLNGDRLYKKLVYKYYRRPEVYKYAYAEQLCKSFIYDKYS